MAAMVNMNNLLNGKDSRWLQLEVCREFQRQKCSRPDTECKFAHPPANVEVQNGRVTACYDSIKGRCNREKPPCKYFHPPQHLKDQLLINGRNHLALKNALMQQMGLSPGQPLVPGQVPTVATNPYLSMPQVGSTYSPYYAPGPIMPAIVGPDPVSVASTLSVVPQAIVTQQKVARTDRIEVCREFQRNACKRSECRFAHASGETDDGTVTVCMDAVRGRCNRAPCRYFHPPLHLQAQIKARATAMENVKTVGSIYYESFTFPGMVPYKRAATDKSGMPVYQPSATTYQQLMQLQQPFVPVSCEYTTPPPPAHPATPSTVSPASSAANVSVVTAADRLTPEIPNDSQANEAVGSQTATATTTQAHMPLNQASSVDAAVTVGTDTFTKKNASSLLDTLPVCPDFNQNLCNLQTCSYVHVSEGDGVEITDGRVAVCRDAAKGRCMRSACKYYHIPIPIPPAPVMAAARQAAAHFDHIDPFDAPFDYPDASLTLDLGHLG